jgi:hypothetical protein
MTHRIVIVLTFVSLLLLPLACGSKDPSVEKGEQTAGDPKPEKMTASPDFSSPSGTANTFIKACADKDIELLSRCFSWKA